ncbi:MAG TPA: hypothetical protein VFN28_01370 [Amaricoccus sp.]|nr:hypothetical protein [Amaricoccus sp.]
MPLAPLAPALAALRAALAPGEAAALAATAGHFGSKPKVAAFLSVSDGSRRATCASGVGNGLDAALKAARDRLRKLLPREADWRWIKADLVRSVTPHAPAALAAEIAATRRNYFRRGIAFDPGFETALLEQELLGIGGIGFDAEKRLVLRLDRIDRHLKSRRLPPLPPTPAETWFSFETTGAFLDRAEPEVHRLVSGGFGNGIRAAPTARADPFPLIEAAGLHLARQLGEDGAFRYGFFPVNQEPIPTYNILRHSSSLYAMLEAWEATGNAAIAERIPHGIDHVIRTALAEVGRYAVIVDRANHDEVKLGAQAAFILAVTKYTALTGDERYLEHACRIAGSIVARFLDRETGSFVHVLDATDLSVKEPFRIIYYDGEAVLALLRLHAVDGEELWLDAARLAFERFLGTDHWKHHDHWLAYASNALTAFDPDRRYVEFGLRNAFGNIDFIHQRDTAYPTFLELLMATEEMVSRLRAGGEQVLTPEAEAKLLATIHHRAEHNRYSHFYPELAMYFRAPGEIAGSFFIRHHGFRVRIDDVEHFISGYCLYRRFLLANGAAWPPTGPVPSGGRGTGG